MPLSPRWHDSILKTLVQHVVVVSLGFSGRGMLDPAFASVAFNLTDPKKVSKIVESEFGFHIIQA